MSLDCKNTRRRAGALPGACVHHTRVLVLPGSRAAPPRRSRYQTSEFPTTSEFPHLPAHIDSSLCASSHGHSLVAATKRSRRRRKTPSSTKHPRLMTRRGTKNPGSPRQRSTYAGRATILPPTTRCLQPRLQDVGAGGSRRSDAPPIRWRLQGYLAHKKQAPP